MLRKIKRWLTRLSIYLDYVLGDKLQQAISGESEFEKKLVLVIGPESTGTRVFTEILSNHPDVLGTPEALQHVDVLDEVWRELESNSLRGAMHALPGFQDVQCILTRRSIPHAKAVAETARPMDFPDLWSLYDLCQQMKLKLVILITARSTAANLASWTINRASSGGFLELSQKQYQAAYRCLFGFLFRAQAPFFFLSLEALLLDRQDYIQSIFQLLGLPEYPVDLDLHPEVNQKRYSWYSKQGAKGDMT